MVIREEEKIHMFSKVPVVFVNIFSAHFLNYTAEKAIEVIILLYRALESVLNGNIHKYETVYKCIMKYLHFRC